MFITSPPSGDAAFPGANGEIVFVSNRDDVDGTGSTPDLTFNHFQCYEVGHSVGAPPPLSVADPNIDRFQCYRVRGGRTRVAGVQTVDQFGTLSVDVRKPFRLCTAVDVNSQGLVEPAANLLCYMIVPTPGASTFRGPSGPVFVNDDFGADAVTVNHTRELCVPSIVTAR